MFLADSHGKKKQSGRRGKKRGKVDKLRKCYGAYVDLMQMISSSNMHRGN